MASSDTTTRRLTFHEDFVVPILSGEKEATVRYDPDDVSVGDELVAQIPEGTRFATLQVTRTATCLAVEALSLIQVFGADYAADTPEGLIDSLNGHYEASIRPGTVVTVIVFGVNDAR